MKGFENFYGLLVLVWWICAAVIASHGWDE